ncbi:hypothetical protein D3C81_631460 [compost metagenome]
MIDQGLELFCIGIGQLLDGCGVEDLTAERPAQRQLAAIHLAVQRQQASQWRVLILVQAGTLPGRFEQAGLLVEASVELPQVVEDDRALGQRRQGLLRFASPQVTQHTVAKPLVGHRAQLLLDRLDRGSQLRLRAQLDRVHAGEPAHRAAQVDSVEQVFAAMALQAHQHLRLRGPTADHTGQRRQQQVVDLRAVSRWCLLQQLAGPGRVQAGADRGSMLLPVLALGVIARQGIAGALQLLTPVVQLMLQWLADGISLQLFCPGLERAGLGRQLRRLPEGMRQVGLLQVFKQNAP